MDLWQAFKDSPLWVKFDLGIVHLAALYTAIRVFMPALRWCGMKMWRVATSIRDSLIWIRNRPSIELIEKPSSMQIQTGKDSDVWSTRFKIRLQNGDSRYPVSVSLSYLQLCLTQGWGRRTKRTALTTDSSPERIGTVELSPKGSPGSVRELGILVQQTFTHREILWTVNLKQPYKWSISHITAIVHPLSLRSLRRFGGSQ